MATAHGLGSICIAASALLLAGCGGGAALLHPAHVLEGGRVSAGAGASGQFVFGKGADAIDRGHVSTNGVGPAADAERAFLGGAVSEAALAPGIAPWVGARVGLGGNNEGGLIYTGRTARVDARHAFGDDTWAISVGLGASAVLLHPPSRHGTPSPDTLTTAGRFTGTSDTFSATGWGLDIPVIAGWRSAASIVQAWVGVRAGLERITGDLDATYPNRDPGFASVAAFRKYGGGLVGAAFGLKPFSVALELDVAYQAVSASADFPSAPGVPSPLGAPGHADTSLNGLTVAPSGAIIGKF